MPSGVVLEETKELRNANGINSISVSRYTAAQINPMLSGLIEMVVSGEMAV
jgi:hypothetical protein